MSKRPVTVNKEYDTRIHLKNATKQAEERGYKDFLIVDVDAHHYETECWAEITKYIENPVIRRISEAASAKGRGKSILLNQVGNQDIGGRVVRYQDRKLEKVEEGQSRDLLVTKRAMEAMGIDYTILFPTPMLSMGMHPQVEVEVACARAYARWITENIVAKEPSIKTMLYLPFNDPDASLKIIEEFSDRPGVVGFMVTATRNKPIHHNSYMKVYQAIEERNLPLGFHGVYSWNERYFEQLNKFISVHALGFPFYNMIHLTNFVINGIPERFPNLKVIWIESGLAWIPFLMQRLDHEYLMRSSEAPSLTKKPSEYMRDFYYTSQPMERPENLDILKTTFDMINAEERLLYASDYPHWDFDLPSVIYDLPFLSEQAKRNILGGNAAKLFNLDK